MKKKGWAKERIDNDYIVDEGTLTDGTINQPIDFKDIELSQKILIINDGKNNFTVKFNSIVNDSFTIKRGEVYKHDLFEVDSLFLSNNSGDDIDYRIIIHGL